MNEQLTNYVLTAYRRDILRESVEVVMPDFSPEQIAAAKAELAKIDALRLGANLARRDFVLYQKRQALEEFLKRAVAQPEPQPNAPDQVGE